MSVAQKIHAVMEKVGYIQKDGQIQGGGNYYYLSEEKLTTLLHVAFADAGLVILPVGMEILADREDTASSGAIMHNTRILAWYMFIDPEDGNSIEVCALGEGSDRGDKVLNKCMTAAYKYVLRQSVMVSTGDDPDHDLSVESTNSERRPATLPERVHEKIEAAKGSGERCTGCDIEVTSGAQAVSMGKFGKVLCPACQRTETVREGAS